MRTRRQVRQIADKGGTHRALQQMKIGEFAVFTDGSFTKAGYHKTIKCPISGVRSPPAVAGAGGAPLHYVVR
jgi:hypothetical protein